MLLQYVMPLAVLELIRTLGNKLYVDFFFLVWLMFFVSLDQYVTTLSLCVQGSMRSMRSSEYLTAFFLFDKNCEIKH